MEAVRSRAAAHRRPGMLTFAAIIMFVVAGLEGLSALLNFAGTGWWVTETGNLVYANFVFWGILDLIIAIIALYAGIDILRGGTFGVVVGYLFAVLGAMEWLFVVPAAPVLAVVVIALLRDGHLRACQVLRLFRGRLTPSSTGCQTLGRFQGKRTLGSHRCGRTLPPASGGSQMPFALVPVALSREGHREGVQSITLGVERIVSRTPAAMG